MPGDGFAFFAKHLLLDQLLGTVPRPETSFEGKTIIITGSNTGLGFEAVHHVVALGAAKVIMAVRSVEKGEAAKRTIQASTGCHPSIIEIWNMDLSSYASVKDFAARATAELPRIDALIENAGIASRQWTWAEDNESMLTVNVVSTFLMAFLLLPKLRETASRYNTRPNLTVVTSELHYMVDFNEKNAPEGIFNNMNDESKGNITSRYATTKLLEVLVVREMAAQRPAETYPVTINLVNPGFCRSELGREDPSLFFKLMMFTLARTAEVGSRTLVHGASAGPDTHGQYLDRCRTMPAATVAIGPAGMETQRKVWDELLEKLDRIQPGIAEYL